jgi:hypothetical protein
MPSRVQYPVEAATHFDDEDDHCLSAELAALAVGPSSFHTAGTPLITTASRGGLGGGAAWAVGGQDLAQLELDGLMLFDAGAKTAAQDAEREEAAREAAKQVEDAEAAAIRKEVVAAAARRSMLPSE